MNWIIFFNKNRLWGSSLLKLSPEKVFNQIFKIHLKIKHALSPRKLGNLD